MDKLNPAIPSTYLATVDLLPKDKWSEPIKVSFGTPATTQINMNNVGPVTLEIIIKACSSTGVPVQLVNDSIDGLLVRYNVGCEKMPNGITPTYADIFYTVTDYANGHDDLVIVNSTTKGAYILFAYPDISNALE